MMATLIPKARVADVTGLSRRALYLPGPAGPIQRPRKDELELRQAVRQVAMVRPTFGHRRVWAMLRREGRRVNHKRVHRLMKVEGLLQPAHFPRPRRISTGNLSAQRPNQKWSTDLTEILTTDRGVCHLMAVVDACTREVVAWDFFPSCGAAEALTVIEQAVWARYPVTGRADGLTLKTDGGPQFIAHRFREKTRILGMNLETNRPHSPEDNGLQESFHGKLKADYLWLRESESFAETRATLERSITDYNGSRPHSSLGYLTPIEYRKKKMEEQEA
jgi:putative transposase